LYKENGAQILRTSYTPSGIIHVTSFILNVKTQKNHD